MYDIEELESLWLKYKIKQYLKRGAIALAIILLIGVPIVYVNSNLDSQEQEAQKRVVSGDKDIVIVNHQENTPPKSKEVIAKEEPTSQPINRATTTSTQQVNQPIAQTQPINATQPQETPKESSNRPRLKLEMVKGADKEVIKELEKRFWVNRNYDDAMYLARYYYKRKNYKKAQEWAMQANTIDSAKSDSWIIFSKAKAKEGHRKEALWVLQKYYDNTGDMEVGLLIDKIRKGETY